MTTQTLRSVLTIAAGLMVAQLVGACTIIYNTNNLQDDAMVVSPEAGPPPDADVQQPTLTAVSPTSVTEGVGSATGARPAIVVLT